MIRFFCVAMITVRNVYCGEQFFGQQACADGIRDRGTAEINAAHDEA